MMIEVAQKHIDEGIPKKPYFCAVACAAKEKFPYKHVAVDSKIIWIGADSYRHNGAEFIRKYDAGEPVTPTTITLHEN